EILSVAAPYRVDLMRHAGRSLIYVVGQERALFERLAEAARGTPASGEATAGLGLDPQQLQGAVDGLKGAQNAVLVLAGAALVDPEATAAAHAFAKAVGAKVLIVGPLANSHGLELIGLLPSHPAYAYPAMLHSARALILSHLDP